MERKEWVRLIAGSGVFAALVLLPLSRPEVKDALGAGLTLTQWYAREHVALCLLPAFLIAGAIAAFIDKAALLRFLGPGANRVGAYAVGSTAGSVLAVCSCTVLPLFAGIVRMGAGLGPAVAFLYAGPAINVLAVILTARVLGVEIGVARGLGAVLFSLVIGLGMAWLFERKQAREPRPDASPQPAGDGPSGRALGTLFASLIAVLVFANWTESPEASGAVAFLRDAKWGFTASAAGITAVALWRWFSFPAAPLAGVAAGVLVIALLPVPASVPFVCGLVGLCALMPRAGDRGRAWWSETWTYTKLVAPLLVGGVFVSGVLLGSEAAGPGRSFPGLIPPGWIEEAAGGNGLLANLGASVVGALMYFATLTEIPIVQGLSAAGMGRGPALALLLAGPALSLPNMIVIHRVLGTRKAAAFIGLVVVAATLTGLLFGASRS